MEKLFVSTAVYELSRRLGMTPALQEIARQFHAPDASSLPVVRTIHALRRLVDVQLYIDHGATIIAKSRSRSFDHAVKSPCEAWLTIDDDVELGTETLVALLQVLDDLVPRIVVVPCVTRAPDGSGVVNVPYPEIFIERQVQTAKLVQVKGGGFGAVGMNRRAMQAIVDAAPASLWYRDHDDVRRLALFHDVIEDEQWFGEDLSFFRRVPAHVTVEALKTGYSIHAGAKLELARL